MALRRGVMIPIVSDADTLRPALICQHQGAMPVRSVERTSVSPLVAAASA